MSLRGSDEKKNESKIRNGRAGAPPVGMVQDGLKKTKRGLEAIKEGIWRRSHALIFTVNI